MKNPSLRSIRAVMDGNSVRVMTMEVAMSGVSQH
jgi:hypothetical protein